MNIQELNAQVMARRNDYWRLLAMGADDTEQLEAADSLCTWQSHMIAALIEELNDKRTCQGCELYQTDSDECRRCSRHYQDRRR